jgi:polyisoprenoid-binding protein YceI
MKRARSLVLLVLIATLLTAMTLSGGFADAYQNQAGVTFEAIPTGEYKIDPGHSVIGFAIRHYEISLVRGRFKEFTGMIRYDAADVTKSTVEFTAKTESIDTGVAGRDTHLRTADFFEVAKYPELTFKSTRLERKTNNAFVLHGDFTLKGVTKQISFPFTVVGAIKDNRGNVRFGVAAETKINRRDYGITWGGSMANGGLNVGNEVMIDLQLEAVKAAAPTTQ